MKKAIYKSYDDLPLLLNVKQGSRRSPAERVRREEEAQRNEGGGELLRRSKRSRPGAYGAWADEMQDKAGGCLRPPAAHTAPQRGSGMPENSGFVRMAC